MKASTFHKLQSITRDKLKFIEQTLCCTWFGRRRLPECESGDTSYRGRMLLVGTTSGSTATRVKWKFWQGCIDSQSKM